MYKLSGFQPTVQNFLAELQPLNSAVGGTTFSEQAVGPVGCTTDRLHHNKLHQSGFSLMRLHGNRASSVPRRWRQRGEGGGGGREGKQNRGG